MTRAWLKRRLDHTCTIQRDNGTAQSSSGQVQSSWENVGTAVSCRYWEENERVASEDTGAVTIKNRMMIFAGGEDVETNDRVTTVKDADGNTIDAGPLSVEDMNPDRDITGEIQIRTVRVERVEKS